VNDIATDKQSTGWGLEWWYNAHFTFGVIQNVFIPILVPTFVLETTGSAGPAGVMMAIIGLGGLAAPVIGGLADKYGAHRWAQLAALLAYAIGGALFAYAGETVWLYYAASAFFGVGSATLLMINPAFIVGAGFSQADEAVRLTRLNQTLIVGQLVAGLGLAALTSAGLSYQARFLIMSAVALASLVLTALTNKAAAERLAAAGSQGDAQTERAPSPGIKTLLFSAFGLLLLAVLFGQLANTSLSGQYPTYMQQVFAVDPSLSSLTLSISSVVTLIVLGLVGRWMAKSGPVPIWLTSMLMYMVTGAALIGLSSLFDAVWAFLPLALYVIYLQAMAWQDMVQPALAARASAAGAATTQGFLLFAVAISYALASIVAADAADAFGFGILAWIVAGGALVAFLIGRVAVRGIRD
jgi:Na+/melibiose symporter-like transporter